MITNKAKYSYGVGALGKDLAYAVVAYYAMFFFTDLAGVSPAFVATLFLFARLWDAFNDPVMGWVVDNTRSRFGKFRPWILIGTMLNAIFTIAVFTIPNGIPIELWIAVSYVLWGMTYTLMDIPFWSMVPALSKTPQERERVAVVPRMFASFAWLLIGVAGLPLVNALGGDDEAQGYFRMAVLIAVVFTISSIITFVNVREIYPADPNAEKVTVKSAVKLIAQNDQLRVLAVILVGFNLMLQIAGGTALYYFKYVVGNESVFSVYAGAMGVAQILGLLLLPRVADRIGREKTFGLATLLPLIGFGGLMIVGQVAPGNLVLTALTSAIANIGVGFWLGLSIVMLADVVDYGQYKFGTRNESLYFSIQPLAVKFAMALAGWIVGMGLTFMGYEANAAQQNQATIIGLQVLMFGIPMLVAVSAYVIYLKYYKINGAFQERILSTLDEREVLAEGFESETAMDAHVGDAGVGLARPKEK